MVAAPQATGSGACWPGSSVAAVACELPSARQGGMMAGNSALRVAITGANGNLGRKLIAAFLASPDIAAIHAIDRDVAGLSPHDPRLSPIQADLRGPALLDALAGMDAVIHLAAQNPIRTPHGKMRALPLT